MNRVVSNLPVTEEYDCFLLWVYKEIWNGLISVYLFVYVYDGRTIRPTEGYVLGVINDMGLNMLMVGY